jgi:uncharacterized SAM-dependent methyltransferase
MSETFFKKYVKEPNEFLLAERMDDGTQIILVKRNDDYLLATSRGEEFPLSYETLDKVRDINSKNMTSLSEYESKVFEKYNSKILLDTLAEQSMLRYLKLEGKEIDPRYRLILDLCIFNPNSILCIALGKDEKEKKMNIEKFIQDNYGIKIDADDNIFTKLLTKLSSDQDFDRRKFLKEALKKKKEE